MLNPCFFARCDIWSRTGACALKKPCWPFATNSTSPAHSDLDPAGGHAPDVRSARGGALHADVAGGGGDFYDFLVLDDARIGVLISDVSGRGVPVAQLASMVNVAIAAQVEYADDPAKIMAGLNSILSGNLQGQFVTGACLFLDLQSGTGRYSAAEHPPLLHYCSADNSIYSVEENGLILFSASCRLRATVQRL